MEDLSIKKLARISMLILALFAYYNFYLKSSVLEVGSIQKKWDNNNPLQYIKKNNFLSL